MKEASKYQSFSVNPLARGLVPDHGPGYLKITLHINFSFRPIVFNVDSPHLFEGTLVMATLADQRKDVSINAKESSSSLNNSKADGHISTQESLNDNSNRVNNPNKILENRKKSFHEENLETSLEPERLKENASLKTTKAKQPFILSSRTEFNDTNLYASGRRKVATHEHDENKGDDIEEDLSLKRKDIDNSSYNTPPQSNKLKPQTPQSKKAKYIFKRTFDATFKPSDVCGTDIILASDSDGEDN